jgi:mannose-6-phosphate isomerase-like protein (cupin superfamily)
MNILRHCISVSFAQVPLLLLVGLAFCAETMAKEPLAATQETKPQTLTPGNAQVFTLDNCTTVFDRAKGEPTKAGYQFWFADKNLAKGQTLKMSVVAPHCATHAPHKHAEDEFFFILEGKAEVFLNGQTRILEAYSSFYCPEWSEHGIRNAGETELKYLVVKKYPTK